MNNHPEMKYYKYVSKSKIDMLYPQIPKSFFKAVDKKVEINLNVLKVSLGEKSIDETMYSRLTAVIEYLDSMGKIGTIAEPKEYFYGKLHLQWTEIYPNVVFYGGILNDTALGLGGSMRHVLGYESIGVEPGISHTPWLVELLSHEIENIITPQIPKLSIEETESRILSSTNYWTRELSKRAFERFEFVAKTLKTGKYGNQQILFGSPIFVASV